MNHLVLIDPVDGINSQLSSSYVMSFVNVQSSPAHLCGFIIPVAFQPLWFQAMWGDAFLQGKVHSCLTFTAGSTIMSNQYDTYSTSSCQTFFLHCHWKITWNNFTCRYLFCAVVEYEGHRWRVLCQGHYKVKHESLSVRSIWQSNEGLSVRWRWRSNLKVSL